MMNQYLFPFAILFALAANVIAQDAPTDEAKQESSQTHVLVVVGAAGNPEFGEQFDSWADDWKKVSKNAGAKLTVIGQTAENQSPENQSIGKSNDHEQLKKAIESIPADGARPLWVVFIGHGTFSGKVAKFNMRGPDVSAQELGEWFKPIQRPLVVVNCASSSSPFINRLSAKNRVIVTATKSGSQYNYARFGEYFAAAIASPDSDLDHDDEVSVHEAFLRASNDVKEFYASESRICTEHALIDDNGDARGTPANMFRGVRVIAKAKKNAKVDGKFGSKITLSPSGKQLPLTDKELKRRDELEQALDKLRSKQSDLTESDYDQSLEPILVELAKIYRAAEQRVAAASP